MESFNKVPILRIRDSASEEVEDFVAVEKKVRISVNGEHAISLFCSPQMIREFVVGVVYNEGLISGGWCAERISIAYGDIIHVDIPATGTLATGERTVTSGCAGGISLDRTLPGEKISDASVFRLRDIQNLYRDFQKRSEGYKATGGVHSAALADAHKTIVFTEDIGRHNAVDKVIGYALLEDIPFHGKVMLASGRLSSEIVSKCARCGIPVLISRAAPTSLSVEMARDSGLTLIGFVRGDRMNIYTGRHRIAL
ncbi:MAG TPA: formate dehydrogenase accessory sulfurtransferase FdhD [Thermodesulfovibrionales bacterium]|nr:formate dehydrogenase accessory sulfurtransferase FdhD [Thermodesulfovibrionales bacterium]